MKQVQFYHSIRQQREPLPEIELSRAASSTPITVDAAQLVAQYEAASGDILLILDEDCPYEEQVHLVLVREDAIIDQIVIGAPYATGLFREIGIDGDGLRFAFNGDEVLRVEARAQGSRLPERLPSGARRRSGWFAPHHLSLSVEAQAA